MRIKEHAKQDVDDGQTERQRTTVQLLCRRGNDSLEAARLLQSAEEEEHGQRDEEATASKLHFVDVRGGLQAYSRDVDENFPFY
jgi:rhodanese-related sulfurtransferase